MQLGGRAGRNGFPSCCHPLYNPLKTVKHSTTKEYCHIKARHRAILPEGLGSLEVVSGSLECCDVCSSGKVHGRVDVMESCSQQKRWSLVFRRSKNGREVEEQIVAEAS